MKELDLHDRYARRQNLQIPSYFLTFAQRSFKHYAERNIAMHFYLWVKS
jgi:hypothetical protein